jgi:hypothetical protein
MNNAVMLVKDRFNLTRQAIESFLQNSKLDWNLTIIDDGSSPNMVPLLTGYANFDKVAVLRTPKPVKVVGRLKNLAVWWSERMFGRGEYLYISDNDGFFTERWDVKLITSFERNAPHVKLLGPYRHPYHLPNSHHDDGVVITDAVQGLGHLMTWDTWDRYGPYDANAPGTNQSEDFAFCRRIVEDGFLVGSIQPDVVFNCGLHDTQGKLCVGVETMSKIPGIIME